MLTALRALVVDRFSSLQWRHHGIGVLQAYIFENVEPEIRLHVWDPRLVRAGIHDSGSIHDHRFDLESTVLVGQVFERTFCTYVDGGGEWSIHHVENARSAGEARGFDGECRPISATRYGASVRRHTHEAGSTYTLPRGVFHETRIDALTVTVCVMHKKEGSARLLVPHGREPVHAFGAPAPAGVQLKILREALAALGGAA